MNAVINPLGLPQIATLANAQRIRVTRVDTSAVVFDRLGAAPSDDMPEAVVAGACGVIGGTFTDLTAVLAHIETQLAGPTINEKLALLKTALKQLATQRRWEVEVGGTVVGGVPIATDDRTKTLLTGADRRARREPGFTTEWKGANGVWVPIGAATIIALSDAVFDHVDRCFAEERRLHGLIDAAADEAAVLALRTQVQDFLVLPY